MYVFSDYRSANATLIYQMPGASPGTLPPPHWWTDLPPVTVDILTRHVGSVLFIRVMLWNKIINRWIDITPYFDEDGISDIIFGHDLEGPELQFTCHEVRLRVRPGPNYSGKIEQHIINCNGSLVGAVIKLSIGFYKCDYDADIGLGIWYVTGLDTDNDNAILVLNDQLWKLLNKTILADSIYIPYEQGYTTNITYNYAHRDSEIVPPTVVIDGLHINQYKCEIGAWSITFSDRIRITNNVEHRMFELRGPNTFVYGWTDETVYSDKIFDIYAGSYVPDPENSQLYITPDFWGPYEEHPNNPNLQRIRWITGDNIDFNTVRNFVNEQIPNTSYLHALKGIIRILLDAGYDQDDIDASDVMFETVTNSWRDTYIEDDNEIYISEAYIIGARAEASRFYTKTNPTDRGYSFDWLYNIINTYAYIMPCFNESARLFDVLATLASHCPAYIGPDPHKNKIMARTFISQNINPGYIINSDTGLIKVTRTKLGRIDKIRIYYDYDFYESEDYKLQILAPILMAIPGQIESEADTETDVTFYSRCWRSADTVQAYGVAMLYWPWLVSGRPILEVEMDMLYAASLGLYDSYYIQAPEYNIQTPIIGTLYKVQHMPSQCRSRLWFIDWGNMTVQPLIFQPDNVTEGMPGSENKFDSDRWLV